MNWDYLTFKLAISVVEESANISDVTGDNVLTAFVTGTHNSKYSSTRYFRDGTPRKKYALYGMTPSMINARIKPTCFTSVFFLRCYWDKY